MEYVFSNFSKTYLFSNEYILVFTSLITSLITLYVSDELWKFATT